MGTRAKIRKSVSSIHAAYSNYKSRQLYLSDIKAALGTATKGDSEPLNFAGAVARTLGDRALSLDLWQRAVALDERNSNAWCNLSLWYREADDLASSLKYAIAARDIDPTPKTWNQLGVAYYNLRQQSNAVVAYREALQLDKNHAEAWANLGNALKDLHKTHEADEAFDRCLAVKPDYAWAIACQAHVKQKLAQRDAACLLTQRALALDPQNAELWLTSLMVNLPLRPPSEDEGQRNIIEFRDYIGRLRAWAESKPENLAKLGERVGYSQPYYIAYRDGNHAPTLSLYGKLMSEAVNAFRPQKATAPRTNDGTRKIKLAIVSGFFFRHSAWDVIIKGIVLNLDRSMFELDLYYTGTMVDDQTTLAKDNCDLFVQGPKTHKAWMELLSQGGYDAILYSEIGMDPFSMHLACLRLAPLQMLTWGHPMTSGLPTIDWYLSGELLESEDADHHYSEKLIRLPGTGVCTSPLEIRPKPVVFKFDGERVPGTRCKLYLCQHAFKYTDSAIRLIADIALAVPEADFFVVRDSKYPEAFQSAVDAMRVEFQRRQLPFEGRVYFLPWMNREQFLGSFSSVDIYLDLPGFSGYTTAWQALSQGIPVVTLEGNHLRQRLAAGLLRKIGETDYIAVSNQHYIQIIQTLVGMYLQNRDQWEALRENLKKGYLTIDNDKEPIKALENFLTQHFIKNGVIEEKRNEKIFPESGNNKNKNKNKKRLIYLSQMSDVIYIKDNLGSYSEDEFIVTDPQILELAHTNKIQNCHLKRINVRPDDFKKALNEAHLRARLIDAELAETRETLFNDVPHPGWDGELFHMFWMRVNTTKYVARALVDILDRETNINLFSPTYPMELYFDSSIGPSIFSTNFNNFHVIEEYSSPSIWRMDSNSWTFDFDSIEKANNEERLDAIVHIPTCFHQKEFFKEYLDARFKNYIELPSLLWDVRFKTDKLDKLVPWANQLTESEANTVKRYRALAREIITNHVAYLVSNNKILEKQIDHFADRSARQAATYLLLKRRVKYKPQIILADHNICFNGPMFSFARLNELDLTVFPHSSATLSNSYLPHGKKVTLIQAPGFDRRPVSLLGDKIEVKIAEKLVSLPVFRSREKCSTVCLLLNSLYGAGLSHIDIFGLRDFYNQLSQLCARNDIKLIIRAKPSGAPVRLLSQIFNININELTADLKRNMSEVAEKTDLCIMFGEPSAALHTFLHSGALTIATWGQEMPFRNDGGENLRYDTIRFYDPITALNYVNKLLEPDFYRAQLKYQTEMFSKINFDFQS